MRSLIVSVALLASLVAFSARADETIAANITKGHWNLGGSLQALSSGGGDVLFQVAPTGQYFVVDNFSAGAMIDYVWDNQGTFDSQYKMGPIVTYYIPVGSSSAANVGAYYLFASHDVRSLGLFVGYSYFILPSVSFGPQFTYVSNYVPNISSNDNFGQLIFQFGIYL